MVVIKECLSSNDSNPVSLRLVQDCNWYLYPLELIYFSEERIFSGI